MNTTLKKIFSVILTLAILLTGTLSSTIVDAAEIDTSEFESDINMPQIKTNVIEINNDTRQESLDFIENGDNIRIVFTYLYDVISKTEFYRNGVLASANNIRSAEECQSLNVSLYNPSLTRAYENRKFSKYTFVNRVRGSRQADDIFFSTLVTTLSAIAAFALAPAYAIAGMASQLRSGFINMGYADGSRVNIKYVVNKYWSNTTDGIDPLIYKTKLVYNVKAVNLKQKQVLYTYNNPI